MTATIIQEFRRAPAATALMLITVALATALTTIGAAACFQVIQSSGTLFTQAVTRTFYKCTKASLTAIKHRPLRSSTQRSSPAKPKKASA